MERDLGIRRPAPSKSEGLSKTAKTFFGLNIFQVFAIGGIQGAMIIWGDFSPVNEKGLGPGRRIYMALFLGSVLYSCFLCLFAVKKQNFLEILAFVLQNYAFIVYSGIQVYHISFKEYENYQIQRQKLLVYLTIVDSTGLFVLNIIFTCLAVKLYREYGWKIYKRVRFNIRLRAKNRSKQSGKMVPETGMANLSLDKDERSRHGDRHHDRDRRERGDRSRGDHRRDRSRSPHRHSGPKLPNNYWFFYY
eukprot:Seg1147.8 transcript_id=Seg1147.8/GoldUCD/mRNA.D3Y31 product="hypothetical protein" protein_id=Seg1147.8/GoldUCD/D3Y31